MIVVSGLIRELIQALDAPNDLHWAGNRDITATRERERLLTTLLLDEIAHATTQALGVPVYRLPSTSPAHASWSFTRKLAAWREVFEAVGWVKPAA